MLSEFREKNYTTIAETLTPGERDTIFRNHFKTITLTDVNGKTTTLKTYYLVLYQETYLNNEPTGKWDYVINRDRFYGTLNDDTTTIYRLQYFLFDRQLQPLSNFLKGE